MVPTNPTNPTVVGDSQFIDWRSGGVAKMVNDDKAPGKVIIAS